MKVAINERLEAMNKYTEKAFDLARRGFELAASHEATIAFLCNKFEKPPFIQRFKNFFKW